MWTQGRIAPNGEIQRSPRPVLSKSSISMASIEGHMKMTPVTTLNESLADPADTFAADTMFRREFGLMPGLVRAVTAGDTQRARLVADHIARRDHLAFQPGVVALQRGHGDRGRDHPGRPHQA